MTTRNSYQSFFPCDYQKFARSKSYLRAACSHRLVRAALVLEPTRSAPRVLALALHELHRVRRPDAQSSFVGQCERVG